MRILIIKNPSMEDLHKIVIGEEVQTVEGAPSLKEALDSFLEEESSGEDDDPSNQENLTTTLH